MDAKSSKTPADASRQFLRHTLATVAYRSGKAIRGVPGTFSEFRANESCRTPGQILAHIGDLYDWALSQAKGQEKWRDSKPLPWDDEAKRFFAALKALDDYLASDADLAATPEKLFQGAIADSLTHIGQVSILRRLASSPVRAENYSRAEIVAGRVGSEQAPPPWEADLK